LRRARIAERRRAKALRSAPAQPRRVPIAALAQRNVVPSPVAAREALSAHEPSGSHIESLVGNTRGGASRRRAVRTQEVQS
jgi:hypothetical protein